MSWKPTLLLVVLAGGLFAFIFLVERHKTPTDLSGHPPQRILNLDPAEVTNLQLRVTNQLVLRAERGPSGGWNLVAPLTYPAQNHAIEGLLRALGEATTLSAISQDELTASGKTVADFGLDVPRASVILQHKGHRTEVLFGAKTPAGDHVYLQLLNQPTIYLANAELANRLPRQANDWRDTTLLHLSGMNWDRLEVRQPNRGFRITRDPTNKFMLEKPIGARADVPKIEALLRLISASQVSEFVSDEPRADLESYGLQVPELELAFGQGTNDVAVLQFGKSPTNDAKLVYARRLSHTNVVLAPKNLLDTLRISANDLRDRHLFSFSTNDIDTLEVSGVEPFAVRRQFNGLWVVIEPQATLVDADLMRDLLIFLQRLEGNIEKDLVTDLSDFGLSTPARQYLLKTTVTNSTGAITNRTLARLDLSAQRGDRVFARRSDENLTVYSIPAGDFEALPSAAWQLRDRRVWTFTTNQVTRLTVSATGTNRVLMRGAAGSWAFADGSEGIVNPDAVEELLYRLGELRADSWIARGETNRALYGFNEKSPKVFIDLKVGDKPYQLQLELASLESAQLPYALARIDGQTWIFRFPLKLYVELLRDLITPLTHSVPRGR